LLIIVFVSHFPKSRCGMGVGIISSYDKLSRLQLPWWRLS